MNHSFSSIDTALTHFTNGELLVVVDDESRENEGDIVFSAAQSTPAKINFALHMRVVLFALPFQKILHKN